MGLSRVARVTMRRTASMPSLGCRKALRSQYSRSSNRHVLSAPSDVMRSRLQDVQKWLESGEIRPRRLRPGRPGLKAYRAGQGLQLRCSCSTGGDGDRPLDGVKDIRADQKQLSDQRVPSPIGMNSMNRTSMGWCMA